MTDPTMLTDDDVALALGRRDLRILALEKALTALKQDQPAEPVAEPEA